MPAPDTRAPLSPRAVAVVIGSLVVITFALVAARTFFDRAEVGAPSQWLLSLTYTFDLSMPRSSVELAGPIDANGLNLYGQRLDLHNLRLTRSRSVATGYGRSRRIVAVARRRGEASVDAQFRVKKTPQTHKPRRTKTRRVGTASRSFRGVSPGIDPGAKPVRQALGRLSIGANAGDTEKMDAVTRYVRRHVLPAAHDVNRSARVALIRGRGNAFSRARAAVAIARAAGLPARTVIGFALTPAAPASPSHWFEIQSGAQWHAFDNAVGNRVDFPANYVAFTYDEPLVAVAHGRISARRFEVDRTAAAVDSNDHGARALFAILNLSRLPLAVRDMLKALLLLPFGALLNAVVRKLCGVTTYGTFTPALLALAAVYVDWQMAAVVFLVVGVLGLVGRSLMPGLELARASRLTVVFTLVALAMALAVSIMAYLGWLSDAPVVLLPIVILTTLVDRFYTVADADGLRAAMVKLAWTALAAIGCFGVFSVGPMAALVLHYPELHLITIALVVALSRYKGTTLVECRGFRWLGRTRATPSPD